MKKLISQERVDSGVDRSRRLAIIAAGATVAGALVPWHASAQGTAYPNKAVKLVVPWPAGGSTDVLGRLLAERLSAKLGQSFVVENKPGATGYIGTQSVLSSAPDGYTLLVMAPSLHTFNAAVAKTMPFDAVNDFHAVSPFVELVSVLVVPASSPYKSMSDLVADARQRPGQISFASYGNGSSTHLIPELLAMSAKTQFLHVPYKGATPAMADLLGGRIGFMMDSLPSSLPYIRSGRLKALAVTSRKRMTLLPEVPALAETFPGIVVVHRIGLGGPAGMPTPIANKLNEVVRQIAREPIFIERLANLGVEPAASASPEEYRQYLLSQRDMWRKVASQARITLD